MEHGTRSQYSSMPLVSRLHHLDFIMKYLEGKISLQKGMEKACLPLDLAMREAYFKGSMLDRVTSLEHRLFQLCLDLESSSTSSASTSASGYASSTFITDLQYRLESSLQTRISSTPPAYQEESETMLLPKKKDPILLKHQAGNKRSIKKEKICSKTGKKAPLKWSHWNILGC